MGEKSSVVLYSTGCANCKSLKAMLDSHNIDYELIESEQAIIDLGFSSAPVLKVNDEVMTFYQAIKWLKTQQTTN